MKCTAMILLWLVVLGVLGVGRSAAGDEQGLPKQFILRPIGQVKKQEDRTTIVLEKQYQPALLGLDGWSHIWVFWWFDRNDTPERRAVLQVHPRGNRNNPLTGVFGTRSPVRPNLIALTLCKIVSPPPETKPTSRPDCTLNRRYSSVIWGNVFSPRLWGAPYDIDHILDELAANQIGVPAGGYRRIRACRAHGARNRLGARCHHWFIGQSHVAFMQEYRATLKRIKRLMDETKAAAE